MNKKLSRESQNIDIEHKIYTIQQNTVLKKEKRDAYKNKHSTIIAFILGTTLYKKTTETKEIKLNSNINIKLQSSPLNYKTQHINIDKQKTIQNSHEYLKENSNEIIKDLLNVIIEREHRIQKTLPITKNCDKILHKILDNINDQDLVQTLKTIAINNEKTITNFEKISKLKDQQETLKIILDKLGSNNLLEIIKTKIEYKPSRTRTIFENIVLKQKEIVQELIVNKINQEDLKTFLKQETKYLFKENQEINHNLQFGAYQEIYQGNNKNNNYCKFKKTTISEYINGKILENTKYELFSSFKIEEKFSYYSQIIQRLSPQYINIQQNFEYKKYASYIYTLLIKSTDIINSIIATHNIIQSSTKQINNPNENNIIELISNSCKLDYYMQWNILHKYSNHKQIEFIEYLAKTSITLKEHNITYGLSLIEITAQKYLSNISLVMFSNNPQKNYPYFIMTTIIEKYFYSIKDQENDFYKKWYNNLKLNNISICEYLFTKNIIKYSNIQKCVDIFDQEHNYHTYIDDYHSLYHDIEEQIDTE